MRTALVATLVLLSLGPWPRAFSALDSVMLPSLTDDSRVSLRDYKGQVLLLSFFEPDCKWCYRQMKVFNQVSKQCNESLQPLSVGVHGDKLSLRQEVRRAKVEYPAVMGTTEFQQYFGDVPATPWTLIFDQHSQLLGKWQGYIRFQQISSLFPEFCPHH